MRGIRVVVEARVLCVCERESEAGAYVLSRTTAGPPVASGVSMPSTTMPHCPAGAETGVSDESR